MKIDPAELKKAFVAAAQLAQIKIEPNDRGPIAQLVPEPARTEVEILQLGSIGCWLERNTPRLHLFLPASAPACALDFAEAFLQCWLRPIYEDKVFDDV